jgi:hypothetical protein
MYVCITFDRQPTGAVRYLKRNDHRDPLEKQQALLSQTHQKSETISGEI